MRAPIPSRRPLTPIERIFGRQRVRQVRRRLGMAALGTSAQLLRPVSVWWPGLGVGLALTAAFLLGRAVG